MGIQKRYEIFLTRATEMHGSKFDYSKAVFVKQKTKIEIVCPEHGSFFQTPDKHVAKNAKGCPSCWKGMMKNVLKDIQRKRKDGLTWEGFLERCEEKYGNKFLYNKESYDGFTKSKITITCPVHGLFSIVPRYHLISGTGCPKCGNVASQVSKIHAYNTVIQQLQEKHGFIYDYPEYNRLSYKNKRSIMDIICQKHGLFKKKAQKHLSGQGCFQCRVDEMIENNILVGGYSEELFREKPEIKNVPAVIYYLKLSKGQFYKIGVSRANLDARIRSIVSKAKRFGCAITVDDISVSEGSLYNCFQKEQQILQENRENRIFTSWSTELFNTDIYNKIKHYFNN